MIKLSSLKKHLTVMLAVPLMALSVSALPAVLSATPAAADFNINGGAKTAQGTNTPTQLFGDGGMITKIVNVILFLIGAVSVIMLIIGGFRYIVSQGDSTKVTSAKNTILYAIIGLIIAILAYAIVNFVMNQVGVSTSDSVTQ